MANEMKASPGVIALIKMHEGFSAAAYDDAGGRRTIGYGHAPEGGETLERVSEAQAEALLLEDIREAEHAVNRLVRVALNRNQFDALVDFTFNAGAGRLEKSTLLALLNAGDYAGAAAQFPRWNHVNGAPCAGLSRRRERERALFLQPVLSE